MPGTALTVAQASRLWAVDNADAARELRRLERDGILKQTARVPMCSVHADDVQLRRQILNEAGASR